MLLKTDNLLEDVKKCLTDPVFDVTQNFSLSKSREFYNKWKKAWEGGMYENNPAVVVETETFPFADLDELAKISKEALTFYENVNCCGFFKDVDWYIYGQNVVVDWYRLKTFDEWLHDGLKEALISASSTPEDGARMIIERELGKGVYTNTAIHLYAEGKISKEMLKRLGTYEKYMRLENRDIEEDIMQARKALEDMEENNVVDEIINMLKRKDTTVLKLKK